MRLLVLNAEGALVEAARWRGGREKSFLLAPRTDYEVYIVDVPPVRGERLDAALPWRIRALYPGSMEATALDHRPAAGRPDRRLVFAADRERLAALRSAAPDSPLLAGCLLLAGGGRAGTWTAALWTSAWVEILRYEGETPSSSRLVAREGGEGGGIEALVRTVLEAAGETPLVIALAADAELEGGPLRKALSDRDAQILSLEKLARRPTAESAEIFRGRSSGFRPNLPRLARLLAALALILTALVPRRTADLREVELRAVRSEYEKAKSRSGAIVERAAELGRLSARRRELESGRAPDAYRILADLAASLGPQVRIRSLTLDGASFRLEAEGSDGLSVLGRLRDSGRFAAVELRQSVVTPGIGERYLLSGSVRE